MNFSPSLKTLDELAVDFQDEDYYLIQDLFPRKGLAFVSGKPGTGKTTFVLQALFSCISNQNFLTKNTESCELVYWVQDGVETAKKRLRCYQEFFNVPSDKVRFSQDAFDLSERRDTDLTTMIKAINGNGAAGDGLKPEENTGLNTELARLYKLTKRVSKQAHDVYRNNTAYQDAIRHSRFSDFDDFRANYQPQECDTRSVNDSVKNQTSMVVVIDTAAAFNTKENESGHFVPNILRIVRECSCLVILVDHLGKDSSRGTRGSSSKEGAADQVIYLDKDRGSSVGRYKVVKDRYQREGDTGSFEIKPEGGTSVLISAAAKPDVSSSFVCDYMNAHPDATPDALRNFLKSKQLTKTGTEAAEMKARQRIIQRYFPDGQIFLA